MGRGNGGSILGGGGVVLCKSTVICCGTISNANNPVIPRDLSCDVTVIGLVVVMPWYAETS